MLAGPDGGRHRHKQAAVRTDSEGPGGERPLGVLHRALQFVVMRDHRGADAAPKQKRENEGFIKCLVVTHRILDKPTDTSAAQPPTARAARHHLLAVSMRLRCCCDTRHRTMSRMRSPTPRRRSRGTSLRPGSDWF